MNHPKYTFAQGALHCLSALIVLWIMCAGSYAALFNVPEDVRLTMIGLNISLATLFMPFFVVHAGLRVNPIRKHSPRRRLLVRRFLCFLACLFTVTLVAADEPQGNDNQANEKWLEPARSKLMHVNGGMPFFPHRANTTGNLVLNVKDFDNAQICGACHTEIYKQWRSSMMSQA
ncbi:MAG: cytochrome c family protein, partial [Pseudomonas sp.]|nr:cytochrome c family protein [Pseudomonas sp.]